MLCRRLLQGTAARPRLCQCSAVAAPRTSLPSQLRWAPRADRRCSVRARWLSTGGGPPRSAAPVRPSGDDDGAEDLDSKKKSGWRDMDPMLVKHGARSSSVPSCAFRTRLMRLRAVECRATDMLGRRVGPGRLQSPFSLAARSF